MLHIVVIVVSVCCYCNVNGAVENKEDFDHFREFSLNLLFQSDIDEFSVEKGAAISSPFGVGYMLANVNEKVWNVTTDGIDSVLRENSTKITDQYVDLLNTLEDGNVTVSSTLFTKEKNSSSAYPEGSQKMKTAMKYLNLIGDWKTSWFAINDKISEETNGKLNDQLVPKGGWWGGAFYHFTMGAFINTFHYKSAWTNKWAAIEPKNFSGERPVPFYETEGSFPVVQAKNYTAISFQLEGGNKSVVFVLPKVRLSEFLQYDLSTLYSEALSSPQNWTQKTLKAQVPSVNITLLDQHYKKLELLGINYTFCVDETSLEDVQRKKGPYFMSPIVQAHHFQFSPEFFEVATATGASVNSEEKLKEEPTDYDMGGPPPGDSVISYETSSEESTTYPPPELVPAILNEQLKSLMSESVEIVEMTENTTPVSAASENAPVVVASSSTLNPVSLASSSVPPTAPTTTEAPVIVDDKLLAFDKPFFWYLNDKNMGPLFFGSVHSLATYEKEYGLENDEDLWLFDAYKTLLWNCP